MALKKAILMYILVVLLAISFDVCWSASDAGASHSEFTSVADDTDDDVMPDNVIMSFKVKDSNMTLNLTRNKNIKNDCSVILFKNGKFEKWTDVKSHFAAFTDETHEAAVLVNQASAAEGKKKTYMGVFRNGDENFIIKPASHRKNQSRAEHNHNQQSSQRSFPTTPPPPTTRGRPPSDPHRHPPPKDNDHNGPPPPPPPGGDRPGRRRKPRRRNRREVNKETGDASMHEILQADTEDQDYKSDTRNNGPLQAMQKYNEEMLLYLAADSIVLQKMQHGVEMLIFADYSIYKRFYDQTDSELSYSTREREAISNIRYYFTHIANGVDLRYKTISTSEFGIYIRLSGIVISLNPGDSPWTEGDGIKELDPDHPHKMHLSHAWLGLDSFQAWLKVNRKDLPPFDQASLITANTLFTKKKKVPTATLR